MPTLLAAFDIDVVQRQLLGSDQRLQIEAEGDHVGGKIFGSFLEGHEYPRLVVLQSTMHQKPHCQQRLAAACLATDQGWPTGGQATTNILSRPRMPVGVLGTECDGRVLLTSFSFMRGFPVALAVVKKSRSR